MKNIIDKNIQRKIRVLYAYPPELDHPDQIKELANNPQIALYDINQLKDLSWFTYDLLLTHQINDQINRLSFSLHIPILCYTIPDIPDRIIQTPNNNILVYNQQSTKSLLDMLLTLKNQRFII